MTYVAGEGESLPHPSFPPLRNRSLSGENRAHALEIESAASLFDLRDLRTQCSRPLRVDCFRIRHEQEDEGFVEQVRAQNNSGRHVLERWQGEGVHEIQPDSISCLLR